MQYRSFNRANEFLDRHFFLYCYCTIGSEQFGRDRKIGGSIKLLTVLIIISDGIPLLGSIVAIAEMVSLRGIHYK